MYPDIDYQLAKDRHAELVATADYHRLVKEAKQAGAGTTSRHRGARRWLSAVVPSKALIAD
jgi:hypothetical protein